ncbi:class I SAM-dependent methyltransferase [Nonlabens xiamenensis]|uniref:class I SAM-dependent methyltransferase n=1 Tax=Nonlabens xiamenensis TaxID=2341043 RepID=UPI000F6108E8|nr:class I SAM-dependent methyltransferase [Nonlabens xiamenensis]
MKNQLHFSSTYLKLQDYFLTQETFELRQDKGTGLLKTFPVPENLDPYYESEEYLSHNDSEKSFFAYCYNWAKSFNLKSKTKLVKKYAGEGCVLDIGAGIGDLVNYLQKHNVNAIGFEPNSKARQFAATKKIILKHSLDSCEDHSFDVITMYHVLEHVPDLQDQLDLLSRLLKPGGILILALPNYNSYDAQFFGKFWAAYDVPRHIYHFNKKAVHHLFQDQYQIIKMKPMWFDSLYVSILSARYQKRKIPFVQGMLLGLWSNLKAIGTKEASSITYVLKKRF